MSVTTSNHLGIHDGDPEARLSRMDTGTISFRLGQFSLFLMDGEPDDSGRRAPDRALDALLEAIDEFRRSESRVVSLAEVRPIERHVREVDLSLFHPEPPRAA